MPSDTRQQSEHEPLLGVRGDILQEEGQSFAHNLRSGTAIIAQLGLVLLAIVVWLGVLSRPINLFSFHPLLNSVGIAFAVQAALILQPTHTPEQKRLGTYIHSALAVTAALAFAGGFTVIELNKAWYHPEHLKSAHSILGLIVYISLVLQALVGATQFFTPGLYGSEENAKKIYKFHRMSGYLVFGLITATVAAATWTDYNVHVLKIRSASVIVSSVLLLAGLYARVKKQKLGFQGWESWMKVGRLRRQRGVIM